MLSSLSALLTPRSSSETARSVDSQCSTRSYRIPSSNYYSPPSIVYGSPTRPHIEMDKPVWEVNGRDQPVSVSGEIEVDISMFRRGDRILPFSIGIHFTAVKRTPSSSTTNPHNSENTDTDSDEPDEPIFSFRGEWNQDGPGNYHRGAANSFIHIAPRTIVDDAACHVRFAIVVPTRLLPATRGSRVYDVAVRAYELGDPDNVTEASAARFMVLNNRRASAHDRKIAAAQFDDAERRFSKRANMSDLASRMNVRMLMKLRGGRGKVY